jgi:CheY-like chemotaxis protein
MNPTILLVEDDENDVFFMERSFRKSSVPVTLHIARDGPEALQYFFGEGEFANREKFPLPCVTLLDLNIPYVHGLDVLKRIREDAELRRLVVVVLTSSAAESDLDRSYELGANSYLLKPTEFDEREEIVELVTRYWLKRNRVPRATAAECGAPDR